MSQRRSVNATNMATIQGRCRTECRTPLLYSLQSCPYTPNSTILSCRYPQDREEMDVGKES
ncbi:hypothetical protein C8J56DRAFT_1051127 [Mycena floridula]|nr:hypothetical protein C8J56DRAFT_1051127 [Mycena floridula]